MPAEVFAALVIVPVVVALGQDGSLTRALVVTVLAAASTFFLAEVAAPDSGIAWSRGRWPTCSSSRWDARRSVSAS